MDDAAAEEFARRWYAAWNAHDLEGILSLGASGHTSAEVVFLDGHGKISRYVAHYADRTEGG